MIKSRQIWFTRVHPDRQQARTAAQLLVDLTGIEAATPIADSGLHIDYDLSRISLQEIEGLLKELGFHLDNSLLSNLKRALYYYTEETERANAGLGTDHTFASPEIFVTRYRKLPHGCRDLRPRHWRTYL